MKSAWLRELLKAHGEAFPLVSRVTDAEPNRVSAALADDNALSRAEWEVLRLACGIEEFQFRQAQSAEVLERLRIAAKKPQKAHRELLYEVRRRNLSRFKELKPGGYKRIADLLGVIYSAINGAATGANSMGKAFTDRLEQALGLESGWLTRDDPPIPDALYKFLVDDGPAPQPSAPASAHLGYPTSGYSMAEGAQALPALHQAVLDKYRQLVMGGQASDELAMELLNRFHSMGKPTQSASTP